MAKVFLDFSVFPKFGRTEGVDYGPGTDYQIRYSKADYLELVKQYVLSSSFRANGPTDFDATFYTPPAGTQVFGGEIADVATWEWTVKRSATNVAYDNTGTIPEFPACPFADGMGDPREDADVQTTASVPVDATQIYLSLFEPMTDASGWDDATYFWLKFSLTFDAGPKNESYECTPSGDSGEIPGSTPSNFITIDYAGTSHGQDLEIPLGDGTTAAYFLDPGGDFKYLVTDIETNNF